MAAGEIPLHPRFAAEHARVKLELLIQIKEGWGRADVSVQQKAACRAGVIHDPHSSPPPISTSPKNMVCLSIAGRWQHAKNWSPTDKCANGND